jgi:hypothetical protein
VTGTGDAEADALRHFLNAQRSVVLAIIHGLDETALKSVLLPSGWSPLGLIEHLGHAERHWFQQVMTGTAVPLPWPAGHDDDVADNAPFTTDHAAADVLAFYGDQCRRSDGVLATTSLDAPPLAEHGLDLEDEVPDLRWIALHMIEETARHAGHLDAARELLDGRVGLGPR